VAPVKKTGSATALVALLLASGCTGSSDNFGVNLATWTPIAVGARSSAEVVDACVSAGKGDTCSTEKVWMSSASVDDPTVLELAPLGPFSPSVAFFTALRAGSTTLRVEAENGLDGKRLSATIVARVASQAKLFMPTTCASPYHYGTDLEVMLSYQLLANDERLWGFGLLPFVSPVATVDANRSSVDSLGLTQVALHTSATPGSGAITSPIDGTLSVPLVIHALGEITALRLPDAASGLPFLVSADALVAGVPLCDDGFLRDVQVDTPATCTLARVGEGLTTPTLQLTGPGPFHLVAMSGSGTCTLTVTLTGTAISLTRSYPN